MCSLASEPAFNDPYSCMNVLLRKFSHSKHLVNRSGYSGYLPKRKQTLFSPINATMSITLNPSSHIHLLIPELSYHDPLNCAKTPFKEDLKKREGLHGLDFTHSNMKMKTPLDIFVQKHPSKRLPTHMIHTSACDTKQKLDQPELNNPTEEGTPMEEGKEEEELSYFSLDSHESNQDKATKQHETDSNPTENGKELPFLKRDQVHSLSFIPSEKGREDKEVLQNENEERDQEMNEPLYYSPEQLGQLMDRELERLDLMYELDSILKL